MQRETARNLMIAGAVFILVWFVVVVLRLLIGIAFLVGIVLLIIGAIMYAVTPRRQ